ncbi:MAG: hypothetical protein ACJ8DQ_08800 [Xanthobacteraceae bacterium]
MPAHVHPGPACRPRLGSACSPTTCHHFDSCNHGGRLLLCEQLPDGSCRCYHSSEWNGPDGYELQPGSKTWAEANASIDPRIADPMGRSPKNVEDALRRFWRPHTEVGGPSKGLALGLIENFVRTDGPGMFPHVNRMEVAEGLLERIKHPHKINQANGMVCGPAAFMYAIVRQDPAAYAKYVTEVYDKGYALLPRSPDFPRFEVIGIKPSAEFRVDTKPSDANAADWIALGSLRDSDNYVHRFDYSWSSIKYVTPWDERAGGTSSQEVTDWFKRFGFREVFQKASSSRVGLDNLKLAEQYYRRNYRVVLLVSSVFLNGRTLAEAKKGEKFDHFIVLAGPINYGPKIKFRIFTWGHYETVPDWPLTADEFLNSYYGFVAARR